MLKQNSEKITGNGDIQISVSEDCDFDYFTVRKTKGGGFSSFHLHASLLYFMRGFWFRVNLLVFLLLPVTLVALWLAAVHNILIFFAYFLVAVSFILFWAYNSWDEIQKKIALTVLGANWRGKTIIYKVGNKEFNQRQLQDYLRQGNTFSAVLIKIPK